MVVDVLHVCLNRKTYSSVNRIVTNGNSSLQLASAAGQRSIAIHSICLHVLAGPAVAARELLSKVQSTAQYTCIGADPDVSLWAWACSVIILHKLRMVPASRMRIS